MRKCVICPEPALCSGYDTCGNSYCQEARHWANRARNAKKGQRAEFQRKADEAFAKVDERRGLLSV